MTTDTTVAELMALVDEYADAFHNACTPDGGIQYADGIVAKANKDALRQAIRRAVDWGEPVAQSYTMEALVPGSKGPITHVSVKMPLPAGTPLYARSTKP